MATESPLRLISSSGSRNWPSKDTASYTSSTTNIAAQELGLLLQEQNIHMNREFSAPNRSGSAPPSVEGSSLAIGELRKQRNLNLKGIVENLNNAIENCETEEQLRSDPAYIAYYHSNVNLNPRLPQPIVSRENRRLVHHIGSFGESWKMPSFDGDRKNTVLSPHKEDSEDDQSLGTESHSSLVSGKYASPLQAHQKNLLDLIQEDPPRTPSPVYTIPSHDCHQSSLGSKEPEEFKTSVSLQSSPSSTQKGVKNNFNNNVEKHAIPSAVSRDIANETNTLGISDDPHDDKFQQHAHRRHIQSTPHSAGSSNRNCQSMPNSYNIMDHFSSMQLKQPSSEVHPASLMPDGVTPSLYTTADTYGSPYYSNMQPANVFPPQAQFALGGYSLNTSLLSPYVTGYSPYNALPMSLEIPASPNFGAIRPGTLPVDIHNQYKYYGEPGVVTQPSFQDPMYMSYLPHSSLVSYSSMGNIPIESPPSTFDQTAPDHRAQATRTRSFNIPSSSSKGGTGSPHYAVSPRNIPVMMHYPTTPLGSPVFHGSPMASSSFSGRRNESMPFSINSPRAAGGAYSTWQGQRGRDKLNDKKPPTILEELKSSKSHKCELTDITGRVVDFSADQHGSRFIQQKLETCTAEEKGSVFQEILPHASTLMTDVFGNYVIQKFFEYGNHEQRKELANKLVGQILPLSLQMYGCRVIQKALEVIDLDQKTRLVRELDGHVMRCVRDQNGNHVIQKCIECVPTDKIDFIISAFRHNVASLSMHPYGCRVIQRVLEHCTDEKQSQCIVDEILQSACSLAQDQYGNYVTQHVLERGKPLERSQIITKIAGQVVQMSQHKFASNVIEKCLEHGNASERDLLIEEIVGQTEGNDNLLVMMKDQFANYVVQKILEICNDRQREILLGRMRVHLQALRKYTYGKHIVARVEQLCGEEPCTSE